MARCESGHFSSMRSLGLELIIAGRDDHLFLLLAIIKFAEEWDLVFSLM